MTAEALPRRPAAALAASQITATDMYAAADISYRQFDLWCRAGYLRPEPGPTGCGHTRTFPPSELRVVCVMALLVAAGLTPDAAHRAARNGGRLTPAVTVQIKERRP